MNEGRDLQQIVGNGGGAERESEPAYFTIDEIERVVVDCKGESNKSKRKDLFEKFMAEKDRFAHILVSEPVRGRGDDGPYRNSVYFVLGSGQVVRCVFYERVPGDSGLLSPNKAFISMFSLPHEYGPQGLSGYCPEEAPEYIGLKDRHLFMSAKSVDDHAKRERVLPVLEEFEYVKEPEIGGAIVEYGSGMEVRDYNLSTLFDDVSSIPNGTMVVLIRKAGEPSTFENGGHWSTRLARIIK